MAVRGAGTKRRLGLVVCAVGALFLAGCSSDDGGDGFISAPYQELRAAHTPRSATITRDERMTTCTVAGGGACPGAAANATVTYACGESSLTIETSNNRRLGPRVDYGPDQPLSLRGKTAQLWRFDAADFEVVWQESPKVWARLSAEDVTHDAAEIAEFANHLVIEQWNSPRAVTRPVAPSDDCSRLTDAR